MGDLEAAGEIVTGGLMGRAVEPGAGEHGVGKRPHSLCLNCGTALIGSHCHRCGQSAHVHRTVGAIGHDIAHGVFHFEGKAWRTLPMLAFHPGELTRRYVAGERARFVSPMAMFLFSVFLMFAVVANLPGWSMGNGGGLLGGNGVQATVDKARGTLDDARKKVDKLLVQQAARLAKLRADPDATAAEIAAAERRLEQVRKERRDVIKAQSLLPAVGSPAVKVTGDPQGWLGDKYRHAKENPQLLIYKMKTSAYKFSWALIPLSLPFIWLLFPLRRSVGLYDHAVFATYSLSFMSLLTVVLGLLGTIGVPGAVLVFAALLIPPIHIYKQLKGGYGLRRLSALWRTFLMVNFIAIITTLFGLMLLYLGVAD